MKLPWRKGEIPKTAKVISLDYYTKGTTWGIPVGIISGISDGEVTYLTDLYVAPGRRGKGIGTDLMKRFLAATKGSTIVVTTGDAAEFYKKFGFKERTALIHKP